MLTSLTSFWGYLVWYHCHKVPHNNVFTISLWWQTYVILCHSYIILIRMNILLELVTKMCVKDLFFSFRFRFHQSHREGVQDIVAIGKYNGWNSWNYVRGWSFSFHQGEVWGLGVGWSDFSKSKNFVLLPRTLHPLQKTKPLYYVPWFPTEPYRYLNICPKCILYRLI